jgi:hypothetical protein
MRTLLLAVVLLFLLVACQETQLEPTPEALTQRGSDDVCPGDHLDPGETVSGDWGTATGVTDGVEYEVNEGWTVTICSKGGPDYNIATITGPDSGILQTPELENGNIPDLSHFSITDIGPSEPTTTPVDETTTPAGGVTSTADGSGTTQPEAGASTTTAPEETSTTGEDGGGSIPLEGSTTTLDPDASTTTVDPDVSTTAGEGASTTIDPDESTIAGTGQEGSGGTGEEGSGQEGTGGSDEGAEDTLAYTGAGEVALAGLAVSLIAAGLLLTLLFRQRVEDD